MRTDTEYVASVSRTPSLRPEPPPPAPLVPLLRLDQLMDILAVSSRTVWRLCKQGVLPRPLHVNRGARWRSDEIAEYLRALSESR